MPPDDDDDDDDDTPRVQKVWVQEYYVDSLLEIPYRWFSSFLIGALRRSLDYPQNQFQLILEYAYINQTCAKSFICFYVCHILGRNWW